MLAALWKARARALAIACGAALLLGFAAGDAAAQERGRRPGFMDRTRGRMAEIFGVRPTGNNPYDGRITFVRLYFEAGRRAMGTGYRGSNGEPPWAHDHPRAESNLMKIMDEITFINPTLGGGNVFSLTDPELFRYPLLYISEPGFFAPTEEEAKAFREYLLKGGFAIFDDFHYYDLPYVLEMMRQVLPGLHAMPLDGSEPIFDSFFRIDIATINAHAYAGGVRWYGIFEDNDRSKRLMAILAGNGDIGESWEFSDTGWIPIDISNDSYKLGVNFIVYALTH